LISLVMNQPRPKHDIEVRHCATLAEYEECVRIEHITWGEEIAVPSAIFVVAHHTGGQVLGAFDAVSGGASSTQMVGFTLALAGVHAGAPFLHSHMTAVLTEFRDRGVGRRLKLFQRQDALKRGIDFIEWTFDPLEFRNAHFNFVRLGAVARRFLPDCYGVTASPLHAGLPTDRLVAEWRLDSQRVKSILADDPMPLKGAAVRIGLPANLSEIRARDRAAAAQVQAEARQQFQKWFAKGYVATGIETRGGTTEYILEPPGAIAGLRLPDIAEG
jgi:predicted GNAT superfamily acetyltransferase